MKNSSSMFRNGKSREIKSVCLLLMMMLAVSGHMSAQTSFKGKFVDKDLRITCVLNLYADSIDVPGLEGLEMCYGYINGNLNGNWVILRVDKLTDDMAVARVTCDRGNDATDVTFKVTADGIQFSQKEQVIKTVSGNKYVKLPKKVIELKRVK